MINDKSLDGAIVLVKGDSMLSKIIIHHMVYLAKLKKVKPLRYSHAETLLWNDTEKQLYTIGAREKGTEITQVERYYPDKEYILLRPIKAITPIENAKLWAYFHQVDPAKYQYGNFLAWITYLKTKLWLSKKGDKRNYCYELAARFADATGRWDKSKSLDQVSIYDLYDNKYYSHE